jgi:hypothetical protein
MGIAATDTGASTSPGGGHPWSAFLAEIAIPSLIFLGIIVVTILLGEALKSAEKKNLLSGVKVKALRGLELLIFFVDLVLFAGYFLLKAWIFVRSW